MFTWGVDLQVRGLRCCWYALVCCAGWQGMWRCFMHGPFIDIRRWRAKAEGSAAPHPAAQYTRVAPAKGFDTLDDDFSYGLLVAALVGLGTAAVAAHVYAKNSMLAAKWA